VAGQHRGGRGPYSAFCGMVTLLVLCLDFACPMEGSDVMVLGTLLFLMGVPFADMQTTHMPPNADLAPPKMMARAFGM